MEIGLNDLARILKTPVAAEYVDYVRGIEAGVLRQRGFDPKTLCILNLELRDCDKDGMTRDRFFLSGDGSGNYYFVSVAAGARNDKVLL